MLTQISRRRKIELGDCLSTRENDATSPVRQKRGRFSIDHREAHACVHWENQLTSSKWRAFCVLAALTSLISPLCKADVPAPPAPPAVPAGYCSIINGELSADLLAFNTLLTIPPTWTPISGGPTLYGANLRDADSNAGLACSGPIAGAESFGYPGRVGTDRVSRSV